MTVTELVRTLEAYTLEAYTKDALGDFEIAFYEPGVSRVPITIEGGIIADNSSTGKTVLLLSPICLDKVGGF